MQPISETALASVDDHPIVRLWLHVELIKKICDQVRADPARSEDEEVAMNFASCRYCTPIVVAFVLLLTGHAAFAQPERSVGETVPPATPERLFAGGFECDATGYRDDGIPEDELIDTPNRIPNGWELVYNGKMPVVDSARIHFAGSCDGSAHVERIEGIDSVLMRALDLEWSAAPGKPFDASLYQQVHVFSGTTYSLSGWMLTLCGGSNTVPRNDCPDGYYMAKMLGIDPTGGIDPNAETVQWVENRRNFVQPDGVTRFGWQNLRIGVTAQAPTITVFARINSPFQWHGNHGFIDALSLVQAPTATLTASTPITGGNVITLIWNGDLGPDIPLILNSSHRLLFDVQYWHDANQRWRDAIEDVEAGKTAFIAVCTGGYRFRVQPRAEQNGPGAWPNQRYPGVWSEPIEVIVPAASIEPGEPFAPTEQLFLPLIGAQRTC